MTSFQYVVIMNATRPGCKRYGRRDGIEIALTSGPIEINSNFPRTKIQFSYRNVKVSIDRDNVTVALLN